MNKKEFLKSKVDMIDGVLLLNDRYALMYENEEIEIQKQVGQICNEHKPNSVLEIGFGLGYSATAFQKMGVSLHVIVEAHPTIYKNAVNWAKQYDNVIIINKFIQDADIEESAFDVVYDDRCELVYNVPQNRTFPYYKVTKESKDYSLPPIKSW